jgi:hypothetical protein
VEIPPVTGEISPPRWYGPAEVPSTEAPLDALIGNEVTHTNIDESDAARLAAQLLGRLDARVAHSAGVARQARRVAYLLDHPWRSAVTDAAWLHDIGYGDAVAKTGFHGLDGARWLRDNGWASATCRLVAWHTSALSEGILRGLYQDLTAEFERPPPLAAAALTWADLTSSPCGEVWMLERRLADILERHPADSTVHRATVAALPALRSAAAEIEAKLARSTEGT